MTIFDRFSPKAIAAYYAENPSNQMDFAGEKLFPKKRTGSLELSWFKGAGGLPVQLKNSAFGSKATIRDRIGFSETKMDIPFFREAMQIGEKDRMELMKFYASPDSEMVKAFITKIYDDAGQLVTSAEVTAEIMRMQLISTGKIAVNNNNVNYDYDYGLPADNKETLAGGDLWSDPTADVITQISEWQDTIEEKTGERPTRAICHKNTFKYLRANTGIKILAKPGDDPTKVALQDKDVMKVLDDVLGLEIMIYSKKYKNQAGVATNFFPEKVFSLLPSGTIGSTYYAPSPEEVDKMALSKVADVEIVGGGISLTTVVIPHPVNREIIASAVMLPSAENLEKIFIATVLA